MESLAKVRQVMILPAPGHVIPPDILVPRLYPIKAHTSTQKRVKKDNQIYIPRLAHEKEVASNVPSWLSGLRARKKAWTQGIILFICTIPSKILRYNPLLRRHKIIQRLA